eukprot:10839380-Prorocentrum_lima.AAC.1
MSRSSSARHSPRHHTPGRRDVENGRYESARSRSTSPSLRVEPGHPMEHGMSGNIASTQERHAVGRM